MINANVRAITHRRVLLAGCAGFPFFVLTESFDEAATADAIPASPLNLMTSTQRLPERHFENDKRLLGICSDRGLLKG
jgi:hypothetical protein